MAEALTQKIYEREDVPRIECRDCVFGSFQPYMPFFPSLFPDLFSHPGTILSTSPQMLVITSRLDILEQRQTANLSLATGVEPERIAGDVLIDLRSQVTNSSFPECIPIYNVEVIYFSLS